MLGHLSEFTFSSERRAFATALLSVCSVHLDKYDPAALHILVYSLQLKPLKQVSKVGVLIFCKSASGETPNDQFQTRRRAGEKTEKRTRQIVHALLLSVPGAERLALASELLVPPSVLVPHVRAQREPEEGLDHVARQHGLDRRVVPRCLGLVEELGTSDVSVRRGSVWGSVLVRLLAKGGGEGKERTQRSTLRKRQMRERSSWCILQL